MLFKSWSILNLFLLLLENVVRVERNSLLWPFWATLGFMRKSGPMNVVSLLMSLLLTSSSLSSSITSKDWMWWSSRLVLLISSKHVFMRAYLVGTHFMYMYSTLFLSLYLTIPFDKFDIDVLRELNVALPSCIWMLRQPCVLSGFYVANSLLHVPLPNSFITITWK